MHLKPSQHLGRFGHEIGMVFQLSDDLIDVIGDQTGKTNATNNKQAPAIATHGQAMPEES